MKTLIAGWLLSLSLANVTFGQTFGAPITVPSTGRAGSSGSGASLMGSSAFGSSSMGAATGSTGQATSGMGQLSSFGQMSGTSGTNPFGAASDAFGSSASTLLGSAVIGRTMGNSMSGMGGMGMGGMGGMGMGRSGMGGMNGRTGLGMNNNQSQNQTTLRTSVRLGFQMPAAPASERAQALQARLARIPRIATTRNVQVAMEGRTAVLRGRIPTKADSLLVERLLKLEPGVDEVRNELVADENQPQS